MSRIDLGADDLLTSLGPGKWLAKGVDDHTLAPHLDTRVGAGCIHRDQWKLVLDRSRSRQHPPGLPPVTTCARRTPRP